MSLALAAAVISLCVILIHTPGNYIGLGSRNWNYFRTKEANLRIKHRCFSKLFSCHMLPDDTKKSFLGFNAEKHFSFLQAPARAEKRPVRQSDVFLLL